MRIVADSNLKAYGVRFPAASPSLKRWSVLVRQGRWKAMADVMAVFGNAKVLNADRVRFEIHGGSCRLIASFDFARQTAYIKFIGTHAECDKVDAMTVAQF
jgi:mRNA interferase HigB